MIIRHFFQEFMAIIFQLPSDVFSMYKSMCMFNLTCVDAYLKSTPNNLAWKESILQYIVLFSLWQSLRVACVRQVDSTAGADASSYIDNLRRSGRIILTQQPSHSGMPITVCKSNEIHDFDCQYKQHSL